MFLPIHLLLIDLVLGHAPVRSDVMISSVTSEPLPSISQSAAAAVPGLAIARNVGRGRRGVGGTNLGITGAERIDEWRRVGVQQLAEGFASSASKPSSAAARSAPLLSRKSAIGAVSGLSVSEKISLAVTASLMVAALVQRASTRGLHEASSTSF